MRLRSRVFFQVSPDRPKQDQQEQDNDASRNRYDPVLLYFRLCLAQLEFLFIQIKNNCILLACASLSLA